jgi:hypothetical protein
MVSEVPQVKENPLDDLAVQVGIKFNDCNITSQHARHAALEVFEKSKATPVYPIADDPSKQQTRLVDLNTSFDTPEGPAELVIIKTLGEKKVRSKKGLLGRLIATSQTFYNDPILAVRIGEDCILPLASFRRRPGSHECDYVQIAPK